jgi:hypothetical protein
MRGCAPKPGATRCGPAHAAAPRAHRRRSSAEERSRLLEQVYKNTDLPDKPVNALGFAKSVPAPEMEALLKNRIVVTPEAARELALQRGITVRDALIAKGLPNERLFLAAPKLRASSEEDAAGRRACSCRCRPTDAATTAGRQSSDGPAAEDLPCPIGCRSIRAARTTWPRRSSATSASG